MAKIEFHELLLADGKTLGERVELLKAQIERHEVAGLFIFYSPDSGAYTICGHHSHDPREVADYLRQFADKIDLNFAEGKIQHTLPKMTVGTKQ